MFIKQVIIEGFKSYKEQVATEEFSPKLNCVVGANGSGKTNFFHAIRFVLSDLFQNLRSEDRLALLHEGAGHQVMSAFVEIVFNNSDNRIPVDKEEVRLRRSIGMKKDEYFLDRRHITKTEVMNLLESAGFSRSNPYYVVQQGKIASLTIMKDSERLDLLKEIGGTHVYEERRRESLKIMQETELKRKQIIEVVSFIEERLKELDEEKEELRKYQDLDKEMRSLEFTIFDKELTEAKQKLDQVEEQKAGISERSTNLHNELADSQEKLSEVEADLTSAVATLKAAENEQEAVDKLRTEAIKKAKNIELDVKEMETQINADKISMNKAQSEMASLKQQIVSTEKLLQNEVLPGFQQEIARERQVSKRLNDCEKELNLLYQKQGRKNQFSSKAERDQLLNREIFATEAMVKKSKEQILNLERDIRGLKDSVSLISRQKTELVGKIEKENEAIASCIAQQSSLKRDRDEAHYNLKSLRRTEASIEDAIRKSKDEIAQSERALESSMPRDARQGVEAVRRLAREHSINGVHGCLIELIRCEDKFFTAVEVTAGNSLFNVVVENDDVSTRLTHYLVRQRAGRVTFYPLNRVHSPSVNLPSGPDTVPLLNKLSFDHKFSQVVGQVFGRAVICRNLDVATRVARSGQVDCVTMDGDQVERKGAMRGGHFDSRKSRLRWVKTRTDSQTKLTSLELELSDIRGESLLCEQRISGVVGEMEKLDAKLGHCRMVLESLRSDLKHMEAQGMAVKRSIEMKERSVSSISESIADNIEVMEAKCSELGTELSGQLQPAEAARLQALAAEKERLKDELSLCSLARMEAEAKKSAVEESLGENLQKRLSELEGIVAGLGVGPRQAELELKRAEWKDAREDASDREADRKSVMGRIEREQKRVRELKAAFESLKEQDDKCSAAVEDCAKDLEVILSRRASLTEQKEELMAKIRDLGSLPAEAFEKHQARPMKELQRLFHRCSQRLKKFSAVNKKALDQFASFTEQREELQQRQQELDDGDEKIRELISVLDMRKDEAIERTFKGVAKNFREVFAELVPAGNGSLVMMKKKPTTAEADQDNDEDMDEEEERQPEGARVEKYSGVKVKVSFSGRGETQSMKQLSGGQKTLVALALIFAIQRCDPAPFYLFDEIDAALDPQYRAAVGSMIRRQADSSDTQFITTTFRPELVKVADQVYGVFHQNRVSKVELIDREDALRFIEQDQSKQQQQQQQE